MVTIDARFNGPPNSAHGGVACGVFASLVDPRSAVVRLLAPPPLDTELTVDTRDGASVISGRQGPVAQVRPLNGELPVEPASWLDDDEIGAARQHWIDTGWPTHPFPTCFGCGRLRSRCDGLELYAGPVPGRDLAAAAWTPDRSLVSLGDADVHDQVKFRRRLAEGQTRVGGPRPAEPAIAGAVEDWADWAAVDCPSGGAVLGELSAGSLMLLGELAVQIAEPPLVGSE